jgi:hypothetical protein
MADDGQRFIAQPGLNSDAGKAPTSMGQPQIKLQMECCIHNCLQLACMLATPMHPPTL